MSSKFGEKELTKFLKRELREHLEPNLKQFRFFGTSEEKPLKGIKFDVYSYNRKQGRIAIWELEIKSGHHTYNVSKVDVILNFQWKPKIFMFHIFSPYYYPREKERCETLAKELKSKYPRRFIYEQVNMKIPLERFERMLNSFQSNKYQAKHRYGKELRKEIIRIAKETLAVL